jgi:hypothetical protein
LIPVFVKSKLLLFGKRTYGELVEHKKVVKGTGITDGSFYYSVIRFNAHGTVIKMWSAQNVKYGSDEKVKIAYDEKEPTDCMIVDISYIYSGNPAIISGFLLLVWIAAYFTSNDRRPVHRSSSSRLVTHVITR